MILDCFFFLSKDLKKVLKLCVPFLIQIWSKYAEICSYSLWLVLVVLLHSISDRDSWSVGFISDQMMVR